MIYTLSIDLTYCPMEHELRDIETAIKEEIENNVAGADVDCVRVCDVEPE